MQSFEGRLTKQGKLLYIPSEPAELLGNSAYAIARNRRLHGIDLMLIASMDSYKSLRDRLCDREYRRSDGNPFRESMRLAQGSEWVYSFKHSYMGMEASGSYVFLRKNNFDRFGTHGKVHVVPEHEFLVILKEGDLGRYMDLRRDIKDPEKVA